MLSMRKWSDNLSRTFIAQNNTPYICCPAIGTRFRQKNMDFYAILSIGTNVTRYGRRFWQSHIPVFTHEILAILLQHSIILVDNHLPKSFKNCLFHRWEKTVLKWPPVHEWHLCLRVRNAEQHMNGMLFWAINVLDKLSDHLRILTCVFEMIFDDFWWFSGLCRNVILVWLPILEQSYLNDRKGNLSKTWGSGYPLI